MTEHEQQDERQFAVHRIYTKDLSYEAPNVPELFRQDGQPKHKIDLNTSADKIDDETFEVILSVTVTTQVADKTAWLVEVQLAGLFGVRGFPEKELPHLLGAYCPNLLFPYVGEVVSNLVTRGGFPPFMLQPVNFDALFAQHRQQMAERAERTEGDTGPTPH